jgi:hypothetical protein
VEASLVAVFILHEFLANEPYDDSMPIGHCDVDMPVRHYFVHCRKGDELRGRP